MTTSKSGTPLLFSSLVILILVLPGSFIFSGDKFEIIPSFNLKCNDIFYGVFTYILIGGLSARFNVLFIIY